MEDWEICEQQCEKFLAENVAECRRKHEHRLEMGTHSAAESELMLENCIAYHELLAQGCLEDCRKMRYASRSNSDGEPFNSDQFLVLPRLASMADLHAASYSRK